MSRIKHWRCISVAVAAALMTVSSNGCLTPDQHSAPPGNSSGPWTVKMNRGVYRYWLGMGHFHTSWLGPASQIASIGEQAPEVEQVSFSGTPQFSFDVEHSSGMKVHVRAGLEDTGKVQNLGLLKLPQPGNMVGSITTGENLVGEVRFDGNRAESAGKGTASEWPLGTITSPVGRIEIVQRSEEIQNPDDSLSGRLSGGLEGLFDPDFDTITEYRLNGQIVATLRERSNDEVSFEPHLAVEGQICIASAIAIRLAQVEMARQQQMASDLNTATRLLQ